MTPDLEPTANRAPRHPVQRFIKRQHCLASMVSKDQVRGQKSRNKLNRRVAPGCHALRSVIYSERRTSQKASERESQRDSALTRLRGFEGGTSCKCLQMRLAIQKVFTTDS